jgi:hypothetical protein
MAQNGTLFGVLLFVNFLLMTGGGSHWCRAPPTERTRPAACYPQGMSDLTSPRLIYFKGFLFLLGGLLASLILLLESRQWKTLLLLALAVWCFAHFYYFAFYVIGHYVDPTYRFAGLWSFVRYLLRRGTVRRNQ